MIKIYANDMMIQQSVAKWQTLQQAHQTSHAWKTQLYKTEQLQHYASLSHGTVDRTSMGLGFQKVSA